MATTVRDIVWLAGWLEGEGCFQVHNCCPTIVGTSTDFDVIERVNKILGGNLYKKPTTENRKECWTLAVGGFFSAGWMMTLYGLMGKRRKAKIRECLAAWRSKPGYAKSTNGKIVPASCHPDRKASSLGLCEPCYEKQRVNNLPEEKKAEMSRRATINARARRKRMTPDERKKLREYNRKFYYISRSRMTEQEEMAFREKGRLNMRKVRENRKQKEAKSC